MRAGLAHFAGLAQTRDMAQTPTIPGRRPCHCLPAVGCLVILAAAVLADPAAPGCGEPQLLTLDAAVAFALQNNPELAAVRQQHGIAAAGTVIARTYPFNPLWEGRVRYANGPNSAGVTNHVPFENTLITELEIRGQGRHRRDEASAALARTDWEIAAQETSLSVRVARAFDTALYRRAKQQLLEETLRLNADAAQRVSRLVELGSLRPADLIVARTEAAATRVLIGPGRAAALAARYELNRLLGVVGMPVEPVGGLPAPPAQWDRGLMVTAALARRADLRAKDAAVAEAEAALRLEIANRLGNPTAGPTQEYDPSQISMVGIQFTMPLPVLNRHRGEVQQREAARGRAGLELRQTEITIAQDVDAALARLEEAVLALNTYEAQVLPDLRKALQGMERLLEQGQIDVLRVIDVRRKLFQARDGALDAQFELSQALADLAAAIGDPSVAVPSCPPFVPLGPTPR